MLKINESRETTLEAKLVLDVLLLPRSENAKTRGSKV